MSINNPMSDKEFDELDHFLLSENTPDDAMTMDILHGYLTAIAIGPEKISPSEWLPEIWGTPEKQKSLFKSEKEGKRVIDLVLRFLNEIEITFEVAPKEYEALFCEYKGKDGAFLVAAPWASGFLEGIALREKLWKPLLEGNQSYLLAPIFQLGTTETKKDLNNSRKLYHDMALEIEKNIPKIYQFWHAQKAL